jgi:hypothetical protein
MSLRDGPLTCLSCGGALGTTGQAGELSLGDMLGSILGGQSARDGTGAPRHVTRTDTPARERRRVLVVHSPSATHGAMRTPSRSGADTSSNPLSACLWFPAGTVANGVSPEKGPGGKSAAFMEQDEEDEEEEEEEEDYYPGEKMQEAGPLSADDISGIIGEKLLQVRCEVLVIKGVIENNP